MASSFARVWCKRWVPLTNLLASGRNQVGNQEMKRITFYVHSRKAFASFIARASSLFIEETKKTRAILESR